MGYTTEFEGRFDLNKELDQETFDFLNKFSETRRMKRKVDVKYGIDGEFYVDGTGEFGQGNDSNIVDYNTPPRTQPGLWCQWIPTSDKMGIEWNQAEKFYDYVEWLRYLIKNFLSPKGFVLNGQVEFQGENRKDRGFIIVKNNEVSKI